jgi:aminomuconate-semialdehyde/2-hydroxymuconate-6-semialdehyde dehydrogenase
MEIIKNYVNGSLIAPIDNAYMDVFEPAIGKVFAQVPDSKARDVEIAVDAAKTAFPKWSSIGVHKRSELMLQLADLMERDLDILAHAESKDTGKPLEVARSVDIPRAIANIRFFATAVLHFSSESHDMDGQAINYTLRKPLGVVACISPWNLPLYLFTWKIAPALAVGNCVVGKPSEITPFTAYLFSKLCIEAGIPAGVLNILHGSGLNTGKNLVVHPDIKAVSFTGGTATGASIAAAVSPMFKKLSLELGGKNPTIVFNDCEFESTLNEVLRASFSNQGQICLCGSRILIQEGIYEQFKNAFVLKVKALRTGNPYDAATQVGALVSDGHMQKVLSYIQLAKDEGGEILCGGEQLSFSAPYDSGYFVAPTVIEGLSSSCRTNQEEIFGPVVTLMPFRDEAEAVELANGTKYGLATSLWTTDLKRTHRMAEKLEFGIVWVNCWMLRDLRTPFGGQKESGLGREGGWEALRFFTETKNVCIKY